MFVEPNQPNWTDTLSSFFDSALTAYNTHEAYNSQPPIGGLTPYGVPYGTYGTGIAPQQSNSSTTLLLLVLLGGVFFFAFGRSK